MLRMKAKGGRKGFEDPRAKRDVAAFKRMMKGFHRMTAKEHLSFAQKRGVRDGTGQWVKLEGDPAVSVVEDQ